MAYNRWLAHHGVKGQKWGEKNGPPYPLDSSKSDGHKLLKGDGSPQGKKKYKTSEKTAHKRATRKTKTVFVSGSSKTQDEASGYYRKELPKDIQKQLDEHMRKGNQIIVGDAPGIDRQVQDYLNAKKYKNVEIYGPGKQVRYSANSKWKTNPIDDPDHEPGSKEWLAKKDIAMTEAADEGLAIVLDEGAKATRKNVQRLSDSGKGVKVYSLNRDGSDNWEDDWDRDTYSQKGLPESQNKVNSKPQKKSISNRINSLMDRVFGNSIKAQEKGQKKIDVNFEPVTSEKAKTKRGETYEINDWNGDAQDTIKAFKSNPEPHISVARKAAVQEARRIIGWYAKDNPEAQRFLNMSDQQLSKRIGLDFVSAYSHGTVEFSFGDAGTGDFLGHEVDVEYDLNRRKVMNVSVNG